MTEESSTLPQLGSGPDAEGLGCGYYSVQDYKDIVQYAADRHIEVIPEIDLPGHSHAAIKAMELRRKRYLAKGNETVIVCFCWDSVCLKIMIAVIF